MWQGSVKAKSNAANKPSIHPGRKSNCINARQKNEKTTCHTGICVDMRWSTYFYNGHIMVDCAGTLFMFGNVVLCQTSVGITAVRQWPLLLHQDMRRNSCNVGSTTRFPTFSSPLNKKTMNVGFWYNYMALQYFRAIHPLIQFDRASHFPGSADHIQSLSRFPDKWLY